MTTASTIVNGPRERRRLRNPPPVLKLSELLNKARIATTIQNKRKRDHFISNYNVQYTLELDWVTSDP